MARLLYARNDAARCIVIAAVTLICCAGCSGVDIVNVIASAPRPSIAGVAYAADARQRLDVYRPSKTKPHAPIVVFFYGGSWRNGDRADYRFVAGALASRGMVVVIPDYRVYSAVRFPTFVEDGARAVRWTRDHATELGGDADDLFLMGHSAGAYIAAMLSLDEHYLADAGVPRTAIRGTIGLAGPYDFKLRPQDAPVFGLASPTQPAPQIQPITHVDSNAPPMLLIYGAKDTTVDPNNSTRLAAALRNVGVEVKTICYSKQDHVRVVLSLARGFRWLAPTLEDVTAFVAKHLPHDKSH